MISDAVRNDKWSFEFECLCTEAFPMLTKENNPFTHEVIFNPIVIRQSKYLPHSHVLTSMETMLLIPVLLHTFVVSNSPCDFFLFSLTLTKSQLQSIFLFYVEIKLMVQSFWNCSLLIN